MYKRRRSKKKEKIIKEYHLEKGDALTIGRKDNNDIIIENILRHMEGLDPLPKFDGHANCYIESGFEKGILIDFNYDVEPLPGKFPLPGIGPFSLLQETAANHWGKMAFRWIYWNMLLPGRPIPMKADMSMAGKELDDATT